MADHRKYLKPPTAAAKIGITVGTLANWRWREVGPPFYRIGSMILYRDDEIDRWIAAGRHSTNDALSPSPEAA